MRDFEHDVRPGVGIGCLVLGMFKRDVARLLGEPSERPDCYDDGDEHWEFDTLNLRVSFSPEDGFRLGDITSSYAWTTLAGQRLVGLTEKALLEGDFGGLGPPVPDGDDDTGRCYLWDDANIMCWVCAEDRIVDSVTVMPLCDDTNQFPRWPAEAVDRPD